MRLAAASSCRAAVLALAAIVTLRAADAGAPINRVHTETLTRGEGRAVMVELK